MWSLNIYEYACIYECLDFMLCIPGIYMDSCLFLFVSKCLYTCICIVQFSVWWYVFHGIYVYECVHTSYAYMCDYACILCASLSIYMFV